MREESWSKMFVVALVLHVVLLAAFGITFKTKSRKIDISSYSVNLVGSVGPGPSGGSVTAARPAAPPASKKEAPAKKAAIREPKSKPVPQPKDKNERSIATSKTKPMQEPKETSEKKEKRPLEASRDEVSSLDEKIRQMRTRTQYMDVGGGKTGAGAGTPKTGGGGVGGSGDGGARPLDPALYAYYIEVQERIERAWRSPGLTKKALETIIALRIRKDGRIMDWQIEARSGDRVFDETVARTLRSIDTLPPIPSSLNLTEVEVGFRFHP